MVKSPQDHTEHRLPAVCAEDICRLLILDIYFFQNRLHRPHNKRNSDKHQRHDDSESCIRDLNSELLKNAPTQPSVVVRCVSAIPATAVGSANGSSMMPSMIAFPGKSYLTSTQAMIIPMTASIAAATNAVKTDCIAR